METTGQTVLVTGASSGFGLRTALLLAAKGWKVYAGVRDPGRNSELLGEAEAAGVLGSMRTVRLDVTDDTQIGEAVGLIEQEEGRLDALINNAGYAAGGFVEETPISVWRAQFETNLFGVAAITRAALPLMRSRPGGKIVLMGSVSGRMGFPALAPYAASKHALEGFGESLRLELAPFGIWVSIIEPGPYRTAIWRKSMAGVSEPAPDSPYAGLFAAMKPMLERSALRGGHPDRVAETVYRVLAADRPKLRYLPGWGERLTLTAKNLLPWSLIERTALRMLAGKR